MHYPDPAVRRALRWRALWLPTAAAWVLCTASDAAAQDLSDDTARVQASWQQVSQRVTRLPPRFLNPGQVLAVRLPAAALDRSPSGCTSVAILGSRTTSFSLTVGPDGPAPRSIKPEAAAHRSAAGALTMVRCGSLRSELADLAVHLNSGRAALDFIIAEGPRPAPALEQLLPERQAGISGALEDVGPTPPVELLPVRVAEAERRAQIAGGRLAPRRVLTAEPQGGGSLQMQLGDGCHRLMLLPETALGRPADVDAELHDPRDRILVRDRSNATDATLELCVGEQTPVELVWVASNRSSKVTLLQATWALPAGLPFEWGPRARGAMAAAHRKRHSPALTAAPVWEGDGLPGRTSIAVEVAPDGCYVVGVAPTRGDQRSMTLSVQVGTATYNDTGGGGYESAMIAFCAAGSRLARVDVESNGQGLFWVGAMWKAGRTPLGAGEAW